MSQAHLKVLGVGPLVTIQDGGRYGLMRYGVTRSGPMDRAAFAIANHVLGCPLGSTAIEVSLAGLKLRCVDGAVTFAVAGGGFKVALDGKPLGSWCVATLRAGSQLTIMPGATGSWCYLAFAGRLQATAWLGSASTFSLAGLGGGNVSSGQDLVVEGAAVHEDVHGEIAMPQPTAAGPFRVVLGPQDRHFPKSAIDALCSEEFTITEAYDRMGMRLSGPALKPASSLDMPSEPIMKGSIQVPGDGMPTVLLADHQTTGGYPKIATVVSADLDRLVQLRTGDRIAFERISPQAAVSAARQARAELDQAMTGAVQRAGSLSDRLHSSNLVGGVIDAADWSV